VTMIVVAALTIGARLAAKVIISRRQRTPIGPGRCRRGHRHAGALDGSTC
jgi:hypothetical protein